MKITKVLSVILLVNVLASASYSQNQDTVKPKKIYVMKKVLVIRSAPIFTLQVNLGYNQAMGQLAGTYNDDFRSSQFIQGRTLGVNKGFGGSLITKLTSPNSHVRFTFSASYARMLTYFVTKTELADKGESKINIFSFGLGLENNFTPNHNVKLYVGAEGLFSVINGKAKLWVENKPEQPFTYDVKIKNSFRIGAAIFGGAEYLLSNSIGLNLGFKLNHANLLLKSAEASGNPSEIDLIDNESASDTPVPYAGKKQLMYLSVFTGVSFYWGISEKRYILPK